MFHFRIRPFTESKEHDDRVGRIQSLRPRQARSDIRIDGAILRIDREQNRAFESMAFRQDPGHLRQPFFRPILFVAAQKYDVFAGSRPGLAFVSDKIGSRSANQTSQNTEPREKSSDSDHWASAVYETALKR